MVEVDPLSAVAGVATELDDAFGAFLNEDFVGLESERRFVEEEALERRPGRSCDADAGRGTCRILRSEVARSGALVREARESVVLGGQEDRMEGTSG